MVGLEGLGLKCNPFQAALAESSIEDPCRLVVAGSSHRRLLRRIVVSLQTAGLPKLFIITGPWGVGKTTVALRAVCDLMSEALRPIHVYVQASEALQVDSREPLFALAVETAVRAWKASTSRISMRHVEKFYPLVAPILKGATPNTNNCNNIKIILNQIVNFIIRQVIEERRPLYIVYDQFEHLVNANPKCLGVAEFTIFFIKELFHAVARARERGYKPRITIVEALHSNVMYKFQMELESKDAPLSTLLGASAVVWNLRPFETPDETRELVSLYLSHTGCSVSPNALNLFSRGAVLRLHEWSGGLPRTIVELAAKAIEEAAETGIKPPLPADLIDKIAVSNYLSPVATKCVGRERELLEDPDASRKFLELIYRAYVPNEPLTSIQVEPIIRGSRIAALKFTVNLEESQENLLVAYTRRRVTTRLIGALLEEAKRYRASRIIILTPGGVPSVNALKLIQNYKRRGYNISIININRKRLLSTALACILEIAKGNLAGTPKSELERMLSVIAYS